VGWTWEDTVKANERSATSSELEADGHSEDAGGFDFSVAPQTSVGSSRPFASQISPSMIPVRYSRPHTLE